MELGVLGLVDHTHPAATELLHDSVVRDGVANHVWEALFGTDVRLRSEASQCAEVFALNPWQAACTEFDYGHIYACMLFYMAMKRTALFLKEQQLKKLQKLSEKTGAPVADEGHCFAHRRIHDFRFRTNVM